MNDKINIKPKTLAPFKRFCMTIGELPTSYLESMSYYEMLLWFTKYLSDTVIPAVNNNAEALEEVQTLFTELQEYVNDYFENLDIQTEINNKLDEMAEDGELAEIIAQYLEVASVLGYNTKNDLKNADNLIDGSITRTIGDTTYNDGKGHYYKIRTLTSGDTIDNENILALTNYPTLIAEKITDFEINSINTELTSLDSRLDNLEKQKKWIFVGDSYSEGYNPDGNTTSYIHTLINKMKLTSGQYTIVDNGGTCFGNSENSFSMLLNSLPADNDVTDILIAGGYNDLGFGNNSIQTGFSNCKYVISTKFPNAKVYVAFIGGTTLSTHSDIHLKVLSYLNGCISNDFLYLENLQYILYNSSYLATDGIHPTQSGQNALAGGLYMALNNGYNYKNFADIQINYNTSLFNAGSCNLHLTQSNNYSVLSNYSGTIYITATASFSVSGDLKIGTLVNKTGIVGSNYGNMWLDIGHIIVQSYSNPAGYYDMYGALRIDGNGDVYLKIKPQINASHDGYLSIGGLHQIQLPVFSLSYMTDML